jgi:Glucose-6-phosphate dehydrogenase, C-terminal domain/Cytochrome b/b6/petB
VTKLRTWPRAIGQWLALRLRRPEYGNGYRRPRSSISWAYVFGSAAFVLLLVEFVTGVCLALVYSPSADNAWQSLLYLNYQVPFGWYLRALHFWGSNFLVVLLILHLLQVFVLGSYKYPRELTWIIGVLLLLLTLALRDVVQNHMLQVLANLIMDPPTGEDNEAMRDQKALLLKAIHPLSPESAVRGQYKGYRSVPGVAPGSTAETFIAVKLSVDTWRWAGVPIYIRAGKEMPVTATEVVVEFKRPPRETFGEIVPTTSSHMRFRLSPDITIALGVRVKTPGEQMAGSDVELVLKREPKVDEPPYRRLLGDAMRGNGELFARQDTVEAQWRIAQPILGNATPLYIYEPGTWGPEEAVQLIGADGPWINPQTPQGT